MGPGISSHFWAMLGHCWNMPNGPITDDYEVPHLPQPSLQTVDEGCSSKSIDPGKMCDFYLNRTIECSSRARKMIMGSSEYGRVKLNPYQCGYLVGRLESAVEDTRKSSIHSSREHEEECLEALKFLHRLAKEVASFIKTCCCNDNTWLQIALTSGSVAMRVSSIAYYLKFCTMVLRDRNKLGGAWLTFSKMKCLWEANFCPEEIALLDEQRLLTLLEDGTMVLSTSRIANILRMRLKSKQQEQMSVLGIWEIDLKSDVQGSKIGRGSTGEVSKVYWAEANMKVARKVHRGSNEYESSFMVEFLSLAELSHPNIVSLLGIIKGDTENGHLIVMELMDGDLRTLMQQRLQDDRSSPMPFSIYEACDIILQVAEGVHYMHENGVIHRDLKSRSILVRTFKEKDK